MKILWQNAHWTVNKDLAKLVWVEWALLLSDLIDKEEYFKNRWQITEDWFFFNTSENIERDTTLKYKSQKKNIKILKENWFIETKLMWVPAKLHFKINTNKILLFINSSIAQKEKLDVPKSKTNNNKEIIIKNNNKEINNNSKELSETEEKKPETFWNEDINQMQEYIKSEIEIRWFYYRPWKYERARIKNILTAKEINWIAQKHDMSIYDFVKNIFVLSDNLKFWNWKINNAETFYKHYDKIYNQWMSVKLQTDYEEIDYWLI